MVKTDIQVRFSDVDMLGHVNNVVLQQYYDLGKTHYLREVLSLPVLWEDLAYIVVNTNTNYFAEVFAQGQFCVVTRIKSLGGKSITFEQEIVDSESGAVKGRSESVLVAFDLKNRVGVLVSEEHRRKIVGHEGNEVEK